MTAKSKSVARNIPWSETNLTNQVDICRGKSDTFFRGGVVTQPFYLRKLDRQQLKHVEMN